MKHSILVIILLYSLSALCQVTPKSEGFETYQIIKKNDTINFYLRRPVKEMKNLLVMIEGSAPSPIWNKIGKICCETYDVINKNDIPDDYGYIVIAKHGYGFYQEKNIVPKNYWKKKTLDFRTQRVNDVIKYVKNHIFKPINLVALGISQGCDVVAKLGTINNDITHIGFWGSGGHNQLTDYITRVRKDVYRGKISEKKATTIVDSLLNQFKKMYNDPSPNKFWDENSYLSYVSFSEPPVDNLLKINIPIFVAIGTADENVPIESAYIIPIEFMKYKKQNLTFKHYVNYDHGFIETLPNKKEIDRTDLITKEFFKWVNNN